MSKKSAGFFLGAVFGAAAGAVAGLFLAPRSGEETRALAADAVNDAWDSALDSYERTSKVVSTKIGEVKPTVDAKTDELRAKVDLARQTRLQMLLMLLQILLLFQSQLLQLLRLRRFVLRTLSPTSRRMLARAIRRHKPYLQAL